MRFRNIFFSNKINQSTIITNWIFFALAGFVVMVSLLGEVNACGSVDFCATTIFFIVFIFSFFMLWVLRGIPGVGNRMGGNNVLFFFLQGISLQKLAWVPIGFIAVLGISYASTLSDYEYAPHMGIFFSGIVMLIAFYATSSIMIPILIHGFYNALVVVLRAGSLFSELPINVPDLEFSFEIFGDLITQVFFQIALVASSEEFFKVFTIAFIVIAVRGKFEQKGYGIKWIAGIISVLVWTSYHMITAI